MAIATNEVPGRVERREARRQAILEAAADLFIERGYGATSLNDVVRRSGGSLSTLYEMFGNKAGLFKALIEDKCLAVTSTFDDATIDSLGPRETLAQYARRLFGLMMSPGGVAVVRLIVAEGQQFPELAPLFFATGPDAGQARIARYLEEQHSRGTLKVDEPKAAAQGFCELVRGEYYLRAVCGVPIEITPEERERHLDRAVDLFLRAHAPTA
jgi:AcrR family transcriptional regulator